MFHNDSRSSLWGGAGASLCNGDTMKECGATLAARGIRGARTEHEGPDSAGVWKSSSVDAEDSRDELRFQ